jgi:hypothetical protein
MVTRARKPGVWTAVGAGAGTALGTALGNPPVGFALGAILGIAWALFNARTRKRSC